MKSRVRRWTVKRMPRYVDAVPIICDILKERDRIGVEKEERYGLGVRVPNRHGASMRGGIRKALRIIETAPTADVEPVRHGRWVEHYAFGAWHYDCPFCEDGYATKEREKKTVNYCSNCGAKMELEVE